MSRVLLDPRIAPPFPEAVLPVLNDTQLRKNVAHATDVITAKRAHLVAERPDWQELRTAAAAIKDEALGNLGGYLEQFEERCKAAGGVVHWAWNAADARKIILKILGDERANEVIKIKSITTAEIHLNEALEGAGIKTYETDLAELILQLNNDQPSHIVVPALHVNRKQIRDIFSKQMALPSLSDDPQALTAAARDYLRKKFLTVPTAICGANFLVAETGSVAVVESEGNGRMCLTLPQTLIAIAGIEKIVPRYSDLEVMLQVLARSATGERMNPYTSLWTGVTPGDGPQKFHIVLLDNGRSGILDGHVERQTLRCIRCGACQNTCPVYRQTGGHAYGSVYSGPIGAILTPQLTKLEYGDSLPYASTLCGACYDVCPVKINIPEVLIDLRAQITDRERKQPRRWIDPMFLAMWIASWVLSDSQRFRKAQHYARKVLRRFTGKDGWIRKLPSLGGRWTLTRDLRAIPDQSFRDWWETRPGKKPETKPEPEPEAKLESAVQPESEAKPEPTLETKLESKPDPVLEATAVFESEPKAKLESVAEPTLEAKAELDEAIPEPKIETTFESKPLPEAMFEPTPEPEAKLESVAEPALEGKAESEAKPEARLETKFESQPEPEATPERKPESEAKLEPAVTEPILGAERELGEAKPESIAESAPEDAPELEAKPEPEVETQLESKPEAEVKAELLPEPAPEAKPIFESEPEAKS